MGLEEISTEMLIQYICKGYNKTWIRSLRTPAEKESDPGLTFRLCIIFITSFCMMDIIAMLCKFRFMDVIAERGYEGILWAKFAPVLMQN